MNSILSLSLEGLGLLFLAILLLFIPSFRSLFDHRANQPHTKPKSRSAVVDFIRGVSISGIVAIHLASYYKYFGPNEPFSTWALSVSNLARFSVPAFLISSGIYLSYSSPSSYWKPKFSGLILPYTCVFLLGATVKFGFPPDWREWILAYLKGSLFAPFYFVPLMVQAYVLFPFILRSLHRTSWVVIFVSSLTINIISNHIFDYVDLGFKTWEPVLLTHFIFFFMAGILSAAKFRHPPILETILGAIPKGNPFWKLLCFLLFAYAFASIALTFGFGFEISNHLIFYPLGMFLILFHWGTNIETKGPPPLPYRIFCSLGKGSLGIFLLHPVLIHFFHSQNPFDPWWIQVPFYFFTWIVNLALPWLIWDGGARILRLFKKP
ncbi:acyltransferase [Leptospira broomii serovar Hurstbridge str. 5399]|uniref:Acyltransferase n=1 Tax=Leptospira broomii serovar Hurstbridge str. 5399 TaxID=1049789 RepID=T0GLK4_9LEPT|nr:acyltransferase [Leptospira broomii]EQA46248.1 acyltransferase [Leptospira broomii serovar Hurstbridge str. 5399]